MPGKFRKRCDHARPPVLVRRRPNHFAGLLIIGRPVDDAHGLSLEQIVIQLPRQRQRPEGGAAGHRALDSANADGTHAALYCSGMSTTSIESAGTVCFQAAPTTFSSDATG